MPKWCGEYSGTLCPCHCEGVENVVVRLWQSRAICLRAECPQCFFYLLDRHASLAMTRGSKGGFLGLSDHPVDYVDTPQ